MQLGHPSAELSSAEQQFELYNCFHAGKHNLYVSKNYGTAKVFLNRVCEGGTGFSPYACRHLGVIYDRGLGVEQDTSEARFGERQYYFHASTGHLLSYQICAPLILIFFLLNAGEALAAHLTRDLTGVKRLWRCRLSRGD